MYGPCGWHKCGVETVASMITPQLQSYESMRWREIKGHRNHFIEVNNIRKEAQKCLRDNDQDDLDVVFSLTLQGEPRVFGVIRSGVFKIMWYDPKHEVCPSLKKGQKQSKDR